MDKCNGENEIEGQLMIRPPRGRTWLLAAGVVSSAMALFHIGIVVVGEPAYRHFGGSSFAERAAAGSWVPAAMLLTIASVFALFAYYGFAGARIGPRPPFLRTGLVFISLLYGVHGLFVVPELAARLTHRSSGMPSHLGVDAIFLAMALPYVVGTVMAWPELSGRAAHRRGV
jgi:putative oxidoreductase